MARHKHHGGAWKVAYADFITTMMALFLVLWLTAQDTRIKEAIERSFKNPFSSLTKESVGIIPNQDAQATHQEKGNFDSPSAVQLELLRRVAEDLAKLLDFLDGLELLGGFQELADAEEAGQRDQQLLGKFFDHFHAGGFRRALEPLLLLGLFPEPDTDGH